MKKPKKKIKYDVIGGMLYFMKMYIKLNKRGMKKIK